MTLKGTTLIFTFLLFASTNFALPSAKISFIQNNLEAAKKLAAQEGKLIMVDFWASWCSPCRWMDEQTFNREEVANYLNNNYISVRVDIDNFDGMTYRKQYGIRFLPTILVLNENGKVLKKYEESMASSKLLRVLKEHDESKNLHSTLRRNRIQSAYRRDVPRKKVVKSAPVKKWMPSTSGASKNLGVKVNNYNNRNSGVYKATAPSNRPNNPNRGLPNSYKKEVANDIGLFRMNVKKAPKSGFSVQVGAYYDYKNVLTEVERFQKAFAEEVLVHISELNGQPCYKVMLGHYSNHTDATKDKAILQEAGIKDSFVKDLSSL